MFRQTYYLLDAVKRLLLDCGIFRSITRRSSVGRYGEPIPWFSLPAIHLLESLDLRRARIFEFGSGNSTKFWQRRHSNMQIRSYGAAEYDIHYHAQESRLNGFYRDNVYVAADGNVSTYLGIPYWLATEKTDRPELFHPYDVFFVDGPIHWRRKELDVALRCTCSEGLIFVDDANWLGDYVADVCDARSLCRIDFAGFSPGVSYTKVTSLLFRNSAWLQGARLLTPPGGLPNFPGMS